MRAVGVGAVDGASGAVSVNPSCIVFFLGFVVGWESFNCSQVSGSLLPPRPVGETEPDVCRITNCPASAILYVRDKQVYRPEAQT